MEARTRAYRTLAPLRFRPLAGAVADLWQIEGTAGAGGFYLSPDPRLVVFLGDHPPAMAMRTTETGPERTGMRAFFIPAGVPLWSRLERPQRFAHVDFHLDPISLKRRLALSGATAPQSALFAPEAEDLRSLAHLAAAEIAAPSRSDMVLDGLLQALLGALLPVATTAPAAGGLRPQQIDALERHVAAHLDEPLGLAELAAVVGLSESWFSRAFKQSTGLPPKRWVARRRIEAAQRMILTGQHSLAEVALSAGFSDQAHLSRAFRQAVGLPPSQWRRLQG